MIAPEVEKELKASTNVGDMFVVLMKHYKLEDCKPGVLIRPKIIDGLKSAINILRPALRVKR